MVSNEAAVIAIAAILDGRVKGGPLEIAKVILETLPEDTPERERIAAEIAVMVSEDVG